MYCLNEIAANSWKKDSLLERATIDDCFRLALFLLFAYLCVQCGNDQRTRQMYRIIFDNDRNA